MSKPVEKLTATQLVERLKAFGTPEHLEGMTRYGINANNTLGVSIPNIRSLARGRRDHQLARDLWATRFHEARILAAFVDDPTMVTPDQMDEWVSAFDSWDVCDQVCISLFGKTPYAVDKAKEWSARSEEFVKRAAFAIMAAMAWQDKKATDEIFLQFLPIIIRESGDSRNFVKKGINWALRQIGKRNPALGQAAIKACHEIQALGTPAGKWIAADALREFSKKGVAES
ncbi:MAG: DNA alkylation repair protein [Anaerolineaceae bacterium]|nr:DNA alkylation repair protein [Anaerolineaceae bacterium]MBN2676467.1 DNA alkylation repair protein [Anaerolineaceae bacterium]